MYSLLAHRYIAQSTNFDKPVELVVSCGGETLQAFLDRAKGLDLPELKIVKLSDTCWLALSIVSMH